MNTILLLLIFTGLVGMLLVIFFMLDRVNELHKHAEIPKGQLDPAAAFGGLTGKNLWDAMIGVPMPGWDQKKIAALRPRYELVLQKHVELMFEDGKLDGREGFASPVRCERRVPTLRGEIESWIPHEFASGIYRAGYALATTPTDEQETIRRQVDIVGDGLFAAAGLPPNSLSAILMPHLDRTRRDGDEESADPDAGGGDPDAHPVDHAMPADQPPAALPAPEAPEWMEPTSVASPDTVAHATGDAAATNGAAEADMSKAVS